MRAIGDPVVALVPQCCVVKNGIPPVACLSDGAAVEVNRVGVNRYSVLVVGRSLHGIGEGQDLSTNKYCHAAVAAVVVDGRNGVPFVVSTATGRSNSTSMSMVSPAP